ncbi:MAG TPA: sulfotransferase domain-containing protein [Candidatus Gastranaerophilales bacterium]|nr:sulfotransferase domain-containing protein [Candidatus Gastranaerophilales bacterium]
MPNKSSILIACMPKSGSTFLANVIANLPDCINYALVPCYGTREQEIEEQRILDFDLQYNPKPKFKIKKLFKPNYKIPKPKFFVSQNHVRHSQLLDNICSRHSIFRVVLCRNLKDIIFSLKDHIVNESTVFPMGNVPKEYLTWEEHKKEEFIVDIIMPWYLNFFAGWSRAADKQFTKFVWYEDLMTDKTVTIMSILRAAGHLEITENEINLSLNTKPQNHKLTRFNKGIAGRGENLSENASNKLSNLLAYYNNFSDLDKSIIKYLI